MNTRKTSKRPTRRPARKPRKAARTPARKPRKTALRPWWLGAKTRDIEVVTKGSAVGPHVTIHGDHSADEILEALPRGWTIHNDDWANGVRTRTRGMSYPISRVPRARKSTRKPARANPPIPCKRTSARHNRYIGARVCFKSKKAARRGCFQIHACHTNRIDGLPTYAAVETNTGRPVTLKKRWVRDVNYRQGRRQVRMHFGTTRRTTTRRSRKAR